MVSRSYISPSGKNRTHEVNAVGNQQEQHLRRRGSRTPQKARLRSRSVSSNKYLPRLVWRSSQFSTIIFPMASFVDVEGLLRRNAMRPATSAALMLVPFTST